jgi:hypothetical protein
MIPQRPRDINFTRLKDDAGRLGKDGTTHQNRKHNVEIL